MGIVLWVLVTFHGAVVPMDNQDACMKAAKAAPDTAWCINTKTGEN